MATKKASTRKASPKKALSTARRGAGARGPRERTQGRASSKAARNKKQTSTTAVSASRTAPKRKTAGPDIGARAPAFDLQDQHGRSLAAGSLGGTPYVLYFYPKDDTPGCTKEACGFRDAAGTFKALGVRVIGVSPDSSARHQGFAKKYGLAFSLLSDPDKAAAKAYGVWGKKQNYGREYMGIVRSTFLVDANGVVRKTWRGVKVPGHVESVLEAARAL